jgi:hypothetical protein
LAAACGGDDDGGPSNSEVAGSWELSFTLSADDETCTVSDMPMELDQDGQEFDGTFGPGTLECGTDEIEIEGNIVNGEIDDGEVEFDLDNTNAHFTGEIDDDGDMDGTTTWTIEGTSITGTWSANKENTD